MDNDGSIVMRPSGYRRFKETEGMPEFSLGMKFGSKQEFRQAMIKYGLGTKKSLNFIRMMPLDVWLFALGTHVLGIADFLQQP